MARLGGVAHRRQFRKVCAQPRGSSVRKNYRLSPADGPIAPRPSKPGDHAILTRAIDDQGNAQPASISWNAQGYGYNVPVPHPVKVT